MSPKYSICQVLREIYFNTNDPEIKLKARIATSMAKAMDRKLENYNRKWVVDTDFWDDNPSYSRLEKLAQLNNDRIYKNHCAAISEKKECITLRHDVDFDIETLVKMLEIEIEHGLTSIIFVDDNSPSYNISDIKSVYNQFHKKGFKFGLHANVAYSPSCTDMDSGFRSFMDSIHFLKSNGIELCYCAPHFYNEKIAAHPHGYSNRDITNMSHLEEVLPSFERSLKFNGKLTDGGGCFALTPRKWIEHIPNKESRGLFQTHPVYYQNGTRDLSYVKCFGRLPTYDWNEVFTAISAVKSELPTFFYQPSYHLLDAFNILSDIAKKEYKKALRVVDAACGVGVLGPLLSKFPNIKYTGYDIAQSFIEIGALCWGMIGVLPRLEERSIYDTPIPGDILLFLGAEDGEIIEGRLFSVFRNYKTILFTTATEYLVKAGKRKNKDYHYTPPETIQKEFGNEFDIQSVKTKNNRLLHHMTRK